MVALSFSDNQVKHIKSKATIQQSTEEKKNKHRQLAVSSKLTRCEESNSV
jgi:hypothetical protein